MANSTTEQFEFGNSQTCCAQENLYRCLARRNQHVVLNWKYAFQHAERHCSCMALSKLHSIVSAKCQTARSLTPVRQTIPNPLTSQPDPHTASGHTMSMSLYTMQKDLIQQFAAIFGRYVSGCLPWFSMCGPSAYFGRVPKTDFLVQNMRPEASLSDRHVQNHTVEGETFNNNAVECGEALCPASPTVCLAMSLAF